jgi:hypothetical protein
MYSTKPPETEDISKDQTQTPTPSPDNFFNSLPFFVLIVFVVLIIFYIMMKSMMSPSSAIINQGPNI